MSAALRLSLLAVPLLLSSWGIARAGEKDAKPLSEKYLAGVRDGVQGLALEVERLEEDIVDALGGDKERGVYRHAEGVLAELGRFEKAIKPGVRQDELVGQFDVLDDKVRKLVKAVREHGRDQRGLQRAADYVNAANEELYYTLSTGAPAAGRNGKVTARQAEAFSSAAKDLQRTAKYILVGGTDNAILHDSLAKLVLAAERFEKSLQNKADAEARRRDFADVDKAWARVVQGVALLKPADNVYLLRTATRVDRLHERLYRLLGVEGKRTGLTVSS